jgi:hypothetical protein
LAIVARLHPAADWIADHDTPERNLPAKQRYLTAGYRESYSARFNGLRNTPIIQDCQIETWFGGAKI